MNGWTNKDQGARQDKTLGIWPIAFIVKAKLKQAKVKRYKLKLNSVLTFKSIQCTLYSVLICTTFQSCFKFQQPIHSGALLLMTMTIARSIYIIIVIYTLIHIHIHIFIHIVIYTIIYPTKP